MEPTQHVEGVLRGCKRMDRSVKTGTWETLKLHPMTLMRMVVQGEATVLGKDKYGRKIYEIVKEDESA